MKIKSYPKTMDQIVRMKMAEREYNAHVEHEKQKAVHNNAIENAKRFLGMGFPIEQVAQGTGLSLSEVQALR